MNSYPTIPYHNKGVDNAKVWVFDKPDGNNLRFGWSKNKGFYKFGSRTTLIDRDNIYGDAIDLFLDKYSSELDYRFKNLYPKDKSATVFAEYFGDNSFSGQHVESDILDIKIFDILIYDGIIIPSTYIEQFGDLDIVPLLDITTFDENLIEDVRNNTFKHPLKEGVVCKGEYTSKRYNNKRLAWACKIKTWTWLDQVKAKYGQKALLKEVNNDKSILKND